MVLPNSVTWGRGPTSRVMPERRLVTGNMERHNTFRGSLLGAALGDALGARREGYPMSARVETPAAHAERDALVYTDDTHMTIGVAESLIECRGVDGARMADRFARDYEREPWRGYGPGPPRIFRLIGQGVPWDQVGTQLYKDGSFGNGAAMRVGPIGLFYARRIHELPEAVRLASMITHSHQLGIEGARIQAAAVAYAPSQTTSASLDVGDLLSFVRDFASSDIYLSKLATVGNLLRETDERHRIVHELGHGIEAFNSVPTALFCFLRSPGDFRAAVLYAVSLGGDTDTIASMAGAISGAYLGADALPDEWLAALENRDYIEDLASRLSDVAPA